MVSINSVPCGYRHLLSCFLQNHFMLDLCSTSMTKRNKESGKKLKPLTSKEKSITPRGSSKCLQSMTSMKVTVIRVTKVEKLTISYKGKTVKFKEWIILSLRHKRSSKQVFPISISWILIENKRTSIPSLSVATSNRTKPSS